MQFFTDFADLAVALPLALCVAAWLAWSGWRRGATLWLAILAGLLATMLLLKLAVLGCGPGDTGTVGAGLTGAGPAGAGPLGADLAGADLAGAGLAGAGLASPSGHTATATFLYGGIAALVLRPRLQGVAALGLSAAALFGASRVALHVHSVADVIVGGAAGLSALLLFAWFAGTPRAPLRPASLLAACVPLALLLHGLRLTLEPHVRDAAQWLAVCG